MLLFCTTDPEEPIDVEIISQDAVWHWYHDSFFASVGDDGHLMMWVLQPVSVLQKSYRHR